MARLCLNMIVRNEAARILRCLHSVAPYVSCYAIVDTGSTDGTQTLIEEFFDKRDIPGVLSDAPFKDFSQARNAALNLARGVEGVYDYILLTDADMELVAEPGAFSKLTAKSYNILQKAGSLEYMNKRLLHRLTPGEYRGVTHEYLDVGNSEDLHSAHFIDHADGSNRLEKYERDIRLLTKGLQDDPTNVRYRFYLANTYRDAGKHREAIHHYKQRIAMGGWDEEVWNSMYEMAKCWKDKKSEDHYVTGMLDAYSFRPSRAEPLYDLARYYRDRGKNATAFMFATKARGTAPSKDLLFVQPHSYKYGPLEEISITGFYGDEWAKHCGFKVTDDLLLDRLTPGDIRDTAKRNMFHYLKPLKDFLPSFEAKQIEFTPPEGYVAMNPSIAKHGNDYWMAIRTVNYTMDDQGRYLIRAGDGSITNDNPIHTRTFLAYLGADLQPASVGELSLPADWPEPKYPLVRSWEDARLISEGDRMWVNAAVREHADDGLPEQFRARVCDDSSVIEYTLDQWSLLRHHPRECQKNWCSIEGRPGLYQYRIGTVVDEVGIELYKHEPKLQTDYISGGSQLVKFNGGWLTVVHEAHQHPHSGRRYYWHRFAYLDHEFALVHLSHPFVLHDREIEFAMGLVLKDDRVYVSYGRRDCEAWLCSVKRTELHDWLGLV